MLRLRFALIALFLTLCLAPAAHAKGDAVQFGQNINITENQSVEDAVCFFCSISVKGALHGDAVSFFGNISIDGETHGDVVTFFGSQELAPESKIGGDMVTFFGSSTLGENATVGGDAVLFFGSQHLSSTARITKDNVVEPIYLIILPILFICGIIWLVRALVCRSNRYPVYPNYPPPQG